MRIKYKYVHTLTKEAATCTFPLTADSLLDYAGKHVNTNESRFVYRLQRFNGHLLRKVKHALVSQDVYKRQMP